MTQFYTHRGQQIRSLESSRRFNPSKLSLPELTFLLEHMGTSPAKAMKDGVPEGVNPNTIRPVLDFFFELTESETAAFIGPEEFRQKCEPWFERCEAIKQTREFNNGADFPVELYAKQGTRWVRGGRGSDFGGIRRYAFDFMVDGLPGSLEDALNKVTQPAAEQLESHNAQMEAERVAQMEAEKAGTVASDRVDKEGREFFTEDEPGRLVCAAPGCGWQVDYEVIEGEDAPRRAAMKSLYRHASGKYRHDDTDQAHADIMHGLKQG